MHVVIHNDKAVNDYPLVPHEKIQAAGDDIFVFIWLKKWLPFQIGSGKELRIVRDKGRHGLKLREVVLIQLLVMLDTLAPAQHQQRRDATYQQWPQGKLSLFQLLVMLAHISTSTTPTTA
jgi:hypothetical protein